MTTNRYRCTACRAISDDRELLHAPSPFNQKEKLTGCPACLSCEPAFEQLCDEHGCDKGSACGWPDGAGGYRYTCFRHSPWAKEAKAC